MIVIDHTNPKYRTQWNNMGANKYNGAFFYSLEISKFMIPKIHTNRNWILVNYPGEGIDDAIVFIHNNLHPENYDWLAEYRNLILVCGVPETCDKVRHLGEPLYLPLSVDVEYVKQFRSNKTKAVAFAGRSPKRNDISLPEGVDFVENMARERFLKTLAKYEKVYAVGRTAIEAKILGCDILPYDPRYPDPSIWEVRDTREMVLIFQRMLNLTEEKLYSQALKKEMWPE